ncbi:MAG: rhomboid family intramembrane serine protease [Candidatus Krumholzibacteriia bacterium]
MVLPLRDIQPRHSFPGVTIALIVVNALMFFHELSLGARLGAYFQDVAFIPVQYFEPGNWIADGRSVIMSMFLHGGWAHLLGNMLYLWIFGDNVEDRLGHAGFFLYYLFCGWFATMAHAYTNTASVVPSIGASGAIAGVLGSYLVMFPRARVLTLIPLGYFIRITELPALVVLGLWFIMQLFNGTMALGAQSAQTAGVAWWAHIGGFAAGLVLGVVFRGRGRQARRTRVERRPPEW